MTCELRLLIALCITAFGALLCIIAAIGQWYLNRKQQQKNRASATGDQPNMNK